MVECLNDLARFIAQSLFEGNLLVLGVLSLITTVIEFGIPVPWVQDTVLLMIGYQPADRIVVLAPLVMSALTVGRLLGASTLYWAVRARRSGFTAWLGRKFPGILSKVQGLETAVGGKTWLAVSLGRYTYGLLIPTTIASGLFGVKYAHFCIGIIISSVIPDGAAIIYGLAVKTGFTFIGIPPSPGLFFVTLILLVVFGWLVNWLWLTRKKGRKPFSRTVIP